MTGARLLFGVIKKPRRFFVNYIFARQTGSWLIVPDDCALNLTANKLLLNDYLTFIGCCQFYGPNQRFIVRCLRYTDRRTEVGRFDETREAELALYPPHYLPATISPMRAQEPDVLAYR